MGPASHLLQPYKGFRNPVNSGFRGISSSVLECVGCRQLMCPQKSQLVAVCPYTPGPTTLPEEPGSGATEHAPVEGTPLTSPRPPGPPALPGGGLPSPSQPSSRASGSTDWTASWYRVKVVEPDGICQACLTSALPAPVPLPGRRGGYGAPVRFGFRGISNLCLERERTLAAQFVPQKSSPVPGLSLRDPDPETDPRSLDAESPR